MARVRHADHVWGVVGTRVAVGALVVPLMVGAGFAVREVLVDDPVQVRALASVILAPDQRGLVITYGGGACDDLGRAELDESRDEVVLRLQYVPQSGDCEEGLVQHSTFASLKQPLGQRVLLFRGMPQRVQLSR